MDEEEEEGLFLSLPNPSREAKLCYGSAAGVLEPLLQLRQTSHQHQLLYIYFGPHQD